jgi:ferredoxin
MIPYLIAGDIVNTGLSAVLVFGGQVLYRSYELAPRLWGISAMDDQATAGAIMWVPGSIVMLVPAIVLAVRAASPPERRSVPVLSKRWQAKPPAPRTRWLYINVARRALQTVMFLIAAAIVADGFWGTQVSPLNLAGVLPWTHWRGLTVIALLVAGNLFCMACPFTLARDAGRRLFFTGPRRQWPKVLRSKWLAVALVAIFFWSYEAFRLWDRPWWTAWIIVGYFATSFLVDGMFQGASFCKYVCPIGQFHFVQSFVSPLEVRTREASVCKSCTTHDCLHGNAQHRGCELLLFQPEKRGNFDCTFCLDCVQACPHDNVAILPAGVASRVVQDRRLSQRMDVIALVLLMVFGAFVTAAGMTGPFMKVLHGVNPKLGSFCIFAIYYFLGLIAAPSTALFVCGSVARDLSGRFVMSLIPLGFGMWLAHLSFHLATGWGAILPLLRLGTNASSAAPVWFELLAIDAGLIVTLYILWQVALRARLSVGRALASVAPWCTLAIGLWAAGFWILLQPMEMR